MDCSAPPCERRQGHLHLVTAADVGFPVVCSSHPGLGRLLLQAGSMYLCSFLPQAALCLPHSQHGWPSPGIRAPLSPTSEHTLDSSRLQAGDPRKPLCCSVWIACLGRYRAPLHPICLPTTPHPTPVLSTQHGPDDSSLGRPDRSLSLSPRCHLSPGFCSPLSNMFFRCFPLLSSAWARLPLALNANATC